MSSVAVGAAANLVIAASYFGIAGVMAVPLVRTRQWRVNRLGSATVAIFFTCAVHHGALGLLTWAGPTGLHFATGAVLFVCNLTFGPSGTAVAAAPSWDWYSVGWDVFGAGVGLYYLTLRKTYRSLMRGPVLFDDLNEQRRRALEINDDIVKRLTVAHLALEAGDVERSAAALDETLVSARAIISDLLGDPTSRVRLGPGDLVRRKAASVPPNAEGPRR